MSVIPTGTVCFSINHTDWRSKAIAWFQGTQYSHVFVHAGTFLDEPMVIESGTKGVAVRPWRHYTVKDYGYTVFYPNFTGQNEVEEALKVLAHDLDRPYGYFGAAWLGLKLLFLRFGIRLSRKQKSRDLVCSGLVFKYLRMLPAVSPKFGHLIAGEVLPKDLFDIMHARPDLFFHTETRP